MDDGGYAGFFAASDGMVLDSGSFLGEYMAFNKPMCFMNRNRTTEELFNLYNDFGKELLSAVDIADTWEEVEHFLDGMILVSDEKSQARKALIRKHFNVNRGRVGEAMSLAILNDLRPT